MILSVRLILLGLLLPAVLPAAADPWAQLKVGLSAADTAALLGHPLSHRRGHGFTTWTYDHGAEVLLHANGAVLGWTAPAATHRSSRSQDIWRQRPAGEYHATMHSVLSRPQNRRTESRLAGGTRDRGSPSET